MKPARLLPLLFLAAAAFLLRGLPVPVRGPGPNAPRVSATRPDLSARKDSDVSARAAPRAHQKADTMSTVTVSGAGDASYNGSFASAGVHDGREYFVLGGSRYLYYDSVNTAWVLNSAILDGGEPYGYIQFGAHLTPNTTDGAWSMASGTAPPPTVSGYVAPTADPTFLSSSLAADGVTLTVNFTVPGTPPLLPAAGVTGFTARAAGAVVPITSGSSATTIVTLILGSTIPAGEAVTISYAPGNVEDTAFNPLQAFAEQPVTNNSTQTAPATVSKSTHLFSTGTLVANWTDAGGAAQSATFATVQDVTLDVSFARKDLWDAAQISVFPVDCADEGGHCTLKASNATISANTLQRLIAATLSGISPITATLPREVTLPVFQAVFTGQDTSGKTVTATAGHVRAKGVGLALKLADFAVQSFELDCYPDADGVVLTIAFAN